MADAWMAEWPTIERSWLHLPSAIGPAGIGHPGIWLT